MASSIKVINVTPSSITFEFTLSSPFNNENYMRVGICNAPFEHGTSKLTGVLCSCYNFTNTNTVQFTMTGINGAAGTSTTLYGYAQSQSGHFWCVPNPDEGETTGKGVIIEFPKDGEYVLDEDTAYNIRSDYSEKFYVNAWTVLKLNISFTNSGTAEITSYSSEPSLLFFCTNDSFDTSKGEPVLYEGFKWRGDSMYVDVKKGVTYYLFLKHGNENYSGFIEMEIIPPTSTSSYTEFNFSSLLSKGLHTNGVSHAEWNNFCDKVIEVLTLKNIQNTPLATTQYGYPVGTSYITMVSEQKINSSEITDRKILAKRFNVIRFIIGSEFQSTGIENKTSGQSPVIASEFHYLADLLNTWAKQ